MSSDRIIVGVDVGLTYTGVAFSTIDWSAPRIINRWPGTDEIRNKVQTAIGYRAGTRSSTSWGFECPPPGEVGRGEAVKDCFKLFLDREVLTKTFQDSASYAVRKDNVSYEDVRNWYKDFLTGLYRHIGEYISASLALADWKKHTIDFLFSVPTTWDGSVINEFESIVKEVGFGQDGVRHSVDIQLTEAEAAAVYTAASSQRHKPLDVGNGDLTSINEPFSKRSDLKEGNIVLVCDSGGGTTDVSVVKIISLNNIETYDQDEMEKFVKLEQLDKVNGDAIGSVQIDDAFREKVDKRLKDISRQFDGIKLPEYAADVMVKGEFQHIKEQVEENPILPEILLEVPGLPLDFDFPGGMIESGRMVFTQNDIREIFDIQINGIFNLVDRQLRRMRGQSVKKVSHFVLSGGLCSSKYVQSQLWRRYSLAEPGVKILIDENPQLVVCKGLVIDRLHRLKYNTFILPSLCCRGSYGILYNEPFDSGKHSRQKKNIRKDPNDGKKYAVDQIKWLIRQGEPIRRDEPLFYPFCRTIDVGSQKMVWQDTIASSNSPADRLPSSINEGDATIVCDIESTLSVDALGKIDRAKKKQKRFFDFKIGRNLLKIDHKVLVYIGSANLRFEVQFEGNTIGSRTVPVKWAFGPEGSGGTEGDNSESSMEEDVSDWYHRLTI